MEVKKMSGLKYFVLGLLAFLTLGMDLFVIPIDMMIYGDKFNAGTFFQGPWYTLVTHWSIVIILWVTGVMLLFKYLRYKETLQDVVSTEKGKDLKPLLITAFILSLLLTIFESVLIGGKIPQFINEYNSFIKYHGNMSIVVSIFQNIYYIAESVLVVLLLALMQRAGEIWFKKDNIPYGGVGLLFTWGIIHFIHGLISGIWISAFSLILGYLFLKANKKWWPSLLFVWLMFFI